ncbi:MAG: peptidoglycan editing factor PgeF [Deinococcales bacterium]
MFDIIRAPNIATLHGFVARAGGISPPPFDTLNLGLSSGDDPQNVESNRNLLLKYLGFDRKSTCTLEQIHSAKVLTVQQGSWFQAEADASVTQTQGLLLIVSVADCLPLLLHDPVAKVIGAAHCGWRGTAQHIAQKTISQMIAQGAQAKNIQAAIGMGIRQKNYQVGAEVMESFKQAGFPDTIAYSDAEGRYRLDVAAALRHDLLDSGIQGVHLWDSALDTYEDEGRFFSHRRDRGRTGRHWAVIALA